MIARAIAIVVLAVVGCSGVAAAQTPATAQPKPKELTTSEDRLTFIQKAQVWVPTKVAEMDLRAGPQGPGAFQPNEAVTCNYVETKLSGTTPKFECAIGDDTVKVRYGKDNGEVQGQVLASRLPGSRIAEGVCDRPFMMLHDVGLTFGQANRFNRGNVGSVNFDQWTQAPMWKGDAAACVGKLDKSNSGTLGDPKISEAGRRFLADLLVQLTDTQLHDLFDVARVELRSRRPGSDERPATVDEWVAAFKHKRDQIVTNRCQS